jgi:O-antigen/teichoic acid export membrane protein
VVRVGATPTTAEDDARAKPVPPARPRFIVSALTTYATSLAVAVAGLANVLVTARFLGPVGRGEIALLTTIAGLTSTIALLGVEQATVNLAGREPQVRRALATNALILSGALGALAIVVLALLLTVFPALAAGLPVALLVLALAAIPLLISRVYFQALLEADYCFAVSNGIRLLSPAAGLIVNGLLGIFGVLTVTTAIAVWLTAQAAGTVILTWFIARRLEGFGPPSLALARRSLRFGVKSHVGHIMGLGNWRLDQWFVGSMAGTRELGLYSVAVAWAEALFILPTALAKVQRPDLVRAAAQRAGRQAATVFRVCVLTTVPLLVVVAAAAPILCTGVFGEDFRGAIDDLRMLLPGTFGIIAHKILGDALIAQRRPMLQNVAVSIGLVFTIALDIVLVPAYGGFGAALASTLAYTALGVAMGMIFMRALGSKGSDLLPRARDVPWLVRKVRSRLPQRRSATA